MGASFCPAISESLWSLMNSSQHGVVFLITVLPDWIYPPSSIHSQEATSRSYDFYNRLYEVFIHIKKKPAPRVLQASFYN